MKEFDKQEVYASQIEPLLFQIRQIARQEKIPMLLAVQINNRHLADDSNESQIPMVCTPGPDGEQHPRIAKAWYVIEGPDNPTVEDVAKASLFNQILGRHQTKPSP